MKTLLLCILILSIAIAPAVLALPDDRFKGGTHDGYDSNAFIQNEEVDLEVLNARFKGGTCDGYDKSTFEDTLVKVSGGTVLIIR